MKAGWEEKALGEVCRLLNGRAYKKPELLSEGKYPVLRVGNFFSNRSWYYSDLELDETKYCDDGDLLYAWSASFGPRIWQGGKVIYHYHIWKIELDETAIDKKFLFYWFDWDAERIQSEQGAGTTMVHVTKTAMEKRTLGVPPLAEQKQIVSVLDQTFAGIGRAAEAARKNRDNARELFETTLNATFAQKGEGWVETTLGEVCGILSKLVDPKEEMYLDLPHLGAGNMISDTGEIVEVKTAREEGLISGKFVFDAGTVLYSKIRPYLKKACCPNFTGLCSADVYPLSPFSGKITGDYLYHLLMSPAFTDYAVSGSSRAGMPKVNRRHLFSYRFWLPSIEQQVAATNLLDHLKAQTQRLEAIYQQKLDALEELKQSLLQKAFAGELTADFNADEAVADLVS